MSLLNHVVEFVKVVASSLGASNGATLYNVSGVAGFAHGADGSITGDDPSDEASEHAPEQEVYQGLGLVGRPLPPDGDAFAEALAFRTEDGLVPFGYRDLRIHRALNPSGTPTTPREGQLLFAGYGGAFLSHSMTDANTGSKRGNVSAWYVPYDFDAGGVAQKAHSIIIDPTTGNQSISIIHGSGLFLQLTENAGSGGPGIVATVDASTFLRLSAGELSVSAAKILLKGNVYLGRQAEAGAPLLPGIASPPGLSVFVSPV